MGWRWAVLAALAGCIGDSTDPGASATNPCGASAIALEPGEVVRLATGMTSCRLAAAPGARYVLAFVDATAIHSAETAREGVFPDYFVTVTLDGAAAAAAPQRAAGELVPEPVPDVIGVQPADSPAERASPWTVGEQFAVRNPFTGLDVTARVQRIYDDHFVVAWLEQGDPARLAALLPRLDSAYPVVRDVAFPLLRSVFADTVPRTATGAGQFLILLTDSIGPGVVGRLVHSTMGVTPLSWMYLKSMANYPAASVIALLTHELTHAYQFLYMHATRSPGAAAGIGAALWGWEGGANSLSYFTLGRHAGIVPDANYDWRAAQPSEAAASYARRAQPLTGELTTGYDNAMGFLRDLILRRMAAGEPFEDALREVSRGAIEGWFGHDGVTVRSGLTARMRTRLGGDWEPARALLDWALSHAADERTPNPYFQDRASLTVWDIPSGALGWYESGRLRTAVPGGVFAHRRFGSPLFVYLQDDGPGLPLRVSAALDLPDLPPAPLAHYQWAVLRIH